MASQISGRSRRNSARGAKLSSRPRADHIAVFRNHGGKASRNMRRTVLRVNGLTSTRLSAVPSIHDGLKSLVYPLYRLSGRSRGTYRRRFEKKGFQAEGRVSLTNAQIGGALRCTVWTPARVEVDGVDVSDETVGTTTENIPRARSTNFKPASPL